MPIDIHISNAEAKELFNALWSEYHDYIEKICRFKLSQHPERAEDCEQKVFLALFAKLQSGDTIINPKAWLYETTSRTIKTEYKAVAKDKELFLRATQNSNVFEEIDVLEAMVNDEIIDDLTDSVISQLSPQDKELLLDIYWKDTKAKDVAIKNGISLDAVHKRMQRLQKRIKNLVKKGLENF